MGVSMDILLNFYPTHTTFTNYINLIDSMSNHRIKDKFTSSSSASPFVERGFSKITMIHNVYLEVKFF